MIFVAARAKVFPQRRWLIPGTGDLVVSIARICFVSATSVMRMKVSLTAVHNVDEVAGWTSDCKHPQPARSYLALAALRGESLREAVELPNGGVAADGTRTYGGKLFGLAFTSFPRCGVAVANIHEKVSGPWPPSQ
jgi:hypothetical protein